MKIEEVKKFEQANNIELPKDTISETGLIGTILAHPDFILKSDYIKPKFFYNRELGCLYHIVSQLFAKSIVEIDNFLIINEIEGNEGYKNIFADISGVSDINEYLDSLKLVARSTVEEYELLANKVITCAFKRESYIKLNELAKDVVSSKDDINETNFKLQQDVSNFSNIYICNKEILTLGEQVDGIWENILSKRNCGFFGFPSKFSELNKYMTYEKTELSMIASPGKTGKSQFLSNEAWDLAISGVPTVYIDRELSTENHTIRMLSYLTGIDNRNIKTGQVSLNEEKLLKEKIQFIKTLPYVHIYKPMTDMSKMYMVIKSLKLKHGIEFLVYDYVKANDGSDSDKEYQKLGRLTDWLKNDIAGSLDLATLGACQMDDKGTKVADSQKILRNCSTLSYFTRKTMEEISLDGKDAGTMKLRVVANRNGATMLEDEYLNLVLDGNKCRVEQAKIPFSESDMPY